MRYVLTIFLFFAILCAPTLKTAFGVTTRADAENRELATRPPLKASIYYLRTYPKVFDLYFNDNFGFRYNLIRLYNRIVYRLHRGRESKRIGRFKVLFGKEGWLFYTGDQIMEDYQGQLPLQEDQLRAWKHDLEEKQRWLTRQGIHYLVVFIPDKHTVYPEYLPSFLQAGSITQQEQLTDYLQKNSSVPILNLTPSVLHEKGQHPLYMKLDTHWNMRGAYVGYREILKRLGNRLDQGRPLPVSFKPVHRKRADLTDLLSLSDILQEQVPELIPQLPQNAAPRKFIWDANQAWPNYLKHEKVHAWQNPQKKVRGILFMDSFGGMIPLLPEHFGSLAYIPTDQGEVDLNFLKQVVKQERPHIVIEERTERYIKRGPSTSAVEFFK